MIIQRENSKNSDKNYVILRLGSVFGYSATDTMRINIMPNLFSKIASQNGEINLFSIQHQVIYQTAFKIFLDYPFFGIGPKMFREVCKQKKYQFKVEEDLSVNGCQLHPHNSYIQLLSETGIVGVIPVIFLLILIIKRFINHAFFMISKKTKLLLTDYQINLYACLLITLFPFVPTGNLFGNWINVIYFLPIGFLLHTYKK